MDYIKNLDHEIIEKISYIHIHRNGKFRKGLTDHWPLTPDCREYIALSELLKRTTSIGVILEINEVEHTHESLSLLQDLRKSHSQGR